MVEVVVEDIAMSGEGSHFLVLLRAGEDDILPIVIDGLQAMSLIAARIDEPPDRPNTHDLMLSTIEMLGGQITRVEINDLQGGTYFGNIFVVSRDMEYEIDARPSDALALALRADCPIFVAQEVLDRHAFTDEDIGEGVAGKGFEA